MKRETRKQLRARGAAFHVVNKLGKVISTHLKEGVAVRKAALMNAKGGDPDQFATLSATEAVDSASPLITTLFRSLNG